MPVMTALRPAREAGQRLPHGGFSLEIDAELKQLGGEIQTMLQEVMA